VLLSVMLGLANAVIVGVAYSEALTLLT